MKTERAFSFPISPFLPSENLANATMRARRSTEKGNPPPPKASLQKKTCRHPLSKKKTHLPFKSAVDTTSPPHPVFHLHAHPHPVILLPTPDPRAKQMSRLVYLAGGSSPAGDPYCWGCKGEPESRTWRVASSKQRRRPRKPQSPATELGIPSGLVQSQVTAQSTWREPQNLCPEERRRRCPNPAAQSPARRRGASGKQELPGSPLLSSHRALKILQ